MKDVALADPAVAEIRIAGSPLWESVGSLLLLTRGEVLPWPYDDWARSVRQALSAGPGMEIVQWFERLTGPVPMFLTPPPESADATMEEELAALRRTPGGTVRAGLSPHAAPSEPQAWLDWFADGLADYWEVAFRPLWAAMRTVLREDFLLRANALATGGAAAVLAQMAGGIRWEPPRLLMSGSGIAYCDRRLVIVPLLFDAWTARCVSDDTGMVALSCQARGAAVLAGRSSVTGRSADPVPGDRLTKLLGRGRATVLRSLTVHATTSAIATSCGLSPSTVSEHLSALLAADVVRRRRIGARVLYELDPIGVALLGYLDSGPSLVDRDPMPLPSGPWPGRLGERS